MRAIRDARSPQHVSRILATIPPHLRNQVLTLLATVRTRKRSHNKGFDFSLKNVGDRRALESVKGDHRAPGALEKTGTGFGSNVRGESFGVAKSDMLIGSSVAVPVTPPLSPMGGTF